MATRSNKNKRVDDNYYLVFEGLSKEEKELITKIKKKIDKKKKKKEKNTKATRCN